MEPKQTRKTTSKASTTEKSMNKGKEFEKIQKQKKNNRPLTTINMEKKESTKRKEKNKWKKNQVAPQRDQKFYSKLIKQK